MSIRATSPSWLPSRPHQCRCAWVTTAVSGRRVRYGASSGSQSGCALEIEGRHEGAAATEVEQIQHRFAENVYLCPGHGPDQKKSAADEACCIGLWDDVEGVAGLHVEPIRRTQPWLDVCDGPAMVGVELLRD